jgi:hypothetical protein
LVGELVISVVVDILGHIRIEHFKSGGVSWIARAAVFFAVLDASEFVVLHPKIRFEDLCGGRESEESRISFGKSSAVFLWAFMGKGR